MEHVSLCCSVGNPVASSPDVTSILDSCSKKYYAVELEQRSPTHPLDVDVTMVTAMQFPMGIVSSKTSYGCRRSWEHIRDNKENIVALRFVRAGALTVSQNGRTCELGPGDMVFTRSNSPFQYVNQPTGGQPSQWYFMLFPLDVVHRYFPNGAPLCTRLPTSGASRLLVSSLLSLIGETGEVGHRAVLENLAAALLKTASDVAEALGVEGDARRSIAEQRYEAITDYISTHLANSEISLNSVAEACNISPRYLCHLLKENGTSFSELLWKSRILKSKEWLQTLNKKHYGISEIAYMTGFKSAAHFSRMFREHFGCSPRDFRRSDKDDAAGEAQEQPQLRRAA